MDFSRAWSMVSRAMLFNVTPQLRRVALRLDDSSIFLLFILEPSQDDYVDEAASEVVTLVASDLPADGSISIDFECRYVVGEVSLEPEFKYIFARWEKGMYDIEEPRIMFTDGSSVS